MSAIDDLLKAEQAGTLDPEGAQLLGEARRRGMAPEGRVTGLGMGKAAVSGAVAGAVAPLGLPGDVRDVAEAGWRKTTDWLGQAAGAVRDFALDDPKDPERKVRPPVQIPPVVGQVAAAVQRPGGLAAQVLEAVMSRRLPGGRDVVEAVGADYAPQNAEERYAQKTAAGVGSAVTLPIVGVAAKVRALMGGMGGAVGEAGRTVMQPTGPVGEAIGEVAGNVLGGLPVALVAGRTPQVVKSTQDFVQEVPAREIARANVARQAAEDTLGERFLLSQGFEQPTTLSAITAELAQSRKGGPIREALNKQIPAALRKAQSRVDDIPGPRLPSQDDANRVAAAGTKAVERPNELVSLLMRPFYGRAGRQTMPASDVKALAQALQDAKSAAHLKGTSSGGQMEGVAATLKDLPDNIITAQGKKVVDARGVPFEKPVNVLNVENIAKEQKAKLRALQNKDPNSASIPPNSEVGLGKTGVTMNQATGAASADLAQGRDVGSRGYRALVDPMQRSVMTRVFPESMRKSGQGDWGSFNAFLRDPNTGPKDVRVVAENLRRADPAAFPMMVKRHLSAALEEARGSESGRMSKAVLDNFPEMVAGAPGSTQRETFRETMRQLALHQRKPPKEFAEGVERLMDTLRMAAREQGAANRIDTTAMGQRAAETATSTALRTQLFQPGYQMARVLERWTHGNTYERLVQTIVDPAKADDIIAIARYSPADVRLRLAAQQLLGIEGQDATKP